MSKRTIKLVGGASVAGNGTVSAKLLPPGQDAGLDAVTSNELAMLAEKSLNTIVQSTDALGGAVRLLATDGQSLHLLTALGLPESVRRAETRVDAVCGACGLALASGGVSTAGAQLCMQRCGMEFFGSRCLHVVAAPLKRSESQPPFGVMTLFFANTAAPAAGGPIMAAFAELLGSTLSNAARHVERQRVALQAERQSIANEIHDALAQTLYFAKMRSSLLQDAMRTGNQVLAHKCAQDIDQALESGQKTVRELVTHFRCQMDPKGLQFALQKLANDFSERNEMPLEYVNRVADLTLPLEQELQALLIVREALVNVSNHSSATKAWLSVVSEGGRYVFTVEDNGRGYASAPTEGHYGLTIMRERALRIGGELHIESLEGAGTRVRLSFAVPPPGMEWEK